MVLDGSSGGDAAVGYLHPELFHVEAKPGWESLAANDAHPPDVQLVPQAYVSQRERLAAHKGSIAGRQEGRGGIQAQRVWEMLLPNIVGEDQSPTFIVILLERLGG